MVSNARGGTKTGAGRGSSGGSRWRGKHTHAVAVNDGACRPIHLTDVRGRGVFPCSIVGGKSSFPPAAHVERSCARTRCVVLVLMQHARRIVGIRMALAATERLFWHCGAHTSKPRIGAWAPIPPIPYYQNLLFSAAWFADRASLQIADSAQCSLVQADGLLARQHAIRGAARTDRWTSSTPVAARIPYSCTQKRAA